MNLDPGQFIEGIDIRLIYREMYLVSEGYLWEMVHRDSLDAQKMEKDFAKLMSFWKKIYLRRREE